MYNSLYTVRISVCVHCTLYWYMYVYTVHCTDLCMCTLYTVLISVCVHCTLYWSLYVYTVQISVWFSLYGKVCKKTSNLRQCTAHLHRSESSLYRSLCFTTHYTLSTQCTVYYASCVAVCTLRSSLCNEQLTLHCNENCTMYSSLCSVHWTLYCLVQCIV